MSSSGRLAILAKFKTNMPMKATSMAPTLTEDPKMDAPDLEGPRLGRWSPTGPRSLMSAPEMVVSFESVNWQDR